VMVIVHHHCEIVCHDCGHGRMIYMIDSWCHRVHDFCFIGLEDRSDSVFYAVPVLPFVRLLRFASKLRYAYKYLSRIKIALLLSEW
jgi:hypothetical protein